MKILMIAPQPVFAPRGTPISVYQRLQALSALQYEVDLLTYHIGLEVSIPGVTVNRGFRVPFIKWVKAGPSLRKAFLDVLLSYQAIVLLCKNHYDVIHSHEEAAFWSILLSKLFHTRHVYDMHSSLPLQLTSTPRWNFWLFVKLFDLLEKWILHTCDVVIAIGVDLEERVKAINPGARVVLIPNLPILTPEAGPSQTIARKLREKMRLGHRLPVIYTGSFERHQALDLLFQSAKVVREHYPDIVFIMVGGTPQQVEHWRNQAIACGLAETMLFTGTVPLAEAIAYLDVAEILVSPRTTGTSVPLKIYSYLQSGKPIVATDLPAHSQVLNCDIAVLVAPTVEAFAEGILTLVRSPELRNRLGLQAQQFAIERFDRREYLEKLARVYQEFELPTHPSKEAAHAPQP